MLLPLDDQDIMLNFVVFAKDGLVYKEFDEYF